jgi:hypothetical protein
VGRDEERGGEVKFLHRGSEDPEAVLAGVRVEYGDPCGDGCVGVGGGTAAVAGCGVVVGGDTSACVSVVVSLFLECVLMWGSQDRRWVPHTLSGGWCQ